MIVERVRSGSGVKAPGAPTSKLEPLSPAYIKVRAKDPNLSSETSPATSNLTRSGDMLAALRVVLSGSRVSVQIPPGKLLDRAYYTNLKRPWANISKGEETRLLAFIDKLVKQKL